MIPTVVPAAAFSARVRIRYRDQGAPALVTPRDDGVVDVDFADPVRAVAPGQAVVFEQGEHVVGGAWIVEGRP